MSLLNRCLLSTILTLLIALPAYAKIVTFKASGPVNLVIDDPTFAPISGVTVGDNFTLIYSFEDATPNLESGPLFLYLDALTSVFVSVGELEFSVSDLGTPTLNRISGRDNEFYDVPPPADGYFDGYFLTYSREHDGIKIDVEFTLSAQGDEPVPALTSTDLFTTPPDLNLFDKTSMAIRFNAADPDLLPPQTELLDFARADITSIELVPENVATVPIPLGGIWLLGSGVLGLAFSKTRK